MRPDRLAGALFLGAVMPIEGSPMEIAQAIVFVLKELKVVQWGGYTLLIVVALRFGFAPAVTAWRGR
jgi:hypothetical protein